MVIIAVIIIIVNIIRAKEKGERTPTRNNHSMEKMQSTKWNSKCARRETMQSRIYRIGQGSKCLQRDIQQTLWWSNRLSAEWRKTTSFPYCNTAYERNARYSLVIYVLFCIGCLLFRYTHPSSVLFWDVQSSCFPSCRFLSSSSLKFETANFIDLYRRYILTSRSFRLLFYLWRIVRFVVRILSPWFVGTRFTASHAKFQRGARSTRYRVWARNTST